MSVDQAKDQAKDETEAKDEAEDKSKDPGIGVSDDIDVSDEQKKEAEEMIETANQNRPTLVLPGSGKTITGGAVNEWLDDDGNPKYESTEKDSDKDGSSDEAKNETAKDSDSDAPPADGAGKAEASEPDDDSGDKPKKKDLTETSDRGARADENADDADKSVEQLNKEAEERVKENFEKDKEFNAAVLEAVKDKEEAST